MHSIWNPWHGCLRCSEGCLNCYMYYLDRMRDQDGARIYRTSGARYPLSKDKAGRYKIRSGEMISVCMTSDFFLEEADPWRPEAWDITFCFLETGAVFIKDGRKYKIPGKREQTRQALRSGMNYQGKRMVFHLKDSWGLPISEEEMYAPHFWQRCEECSMKMLCNGCSDCGKYGKNEAG